MRPEFGELTFASKPAPGGCENEDCVVVGPDWAAVLDGATQPPGVTGGCVHGVAWLARHLGGALAVRLTEGSGEPLADLLAAAIEAVKARHSDCDLDDPDSPSATVTMVRRNAERMDWLVLCDSPLLLDLRDRLKVVLDDRAARLPDYTIEGVRKARNAPGGFWVASTRPEAAYEALTGSVETHDLNRAALLTDGASRLVERFGRTDWPGLLDLLESQGPKGLIAQTREAEAEAEARETAGPRRSKPYDDATAVLIHT